MRSHGRTSHLLWPSHRLNPPLSLRTPSVRGCFSGLLPLLDAIQDSGKGKERVEGAAAFVPFFAHTDRKSLADQRLCEVYGAEHLLRLFGSNLCFFLLFFPAHLIPLPPPNSQVAWGVGSCWNDSRRHGSGGVCDRRVSKVGGNNKKARGWGERERERARGLINISRYMEEKAQDFFEPSPYEAPTTQYLRLFCWCHIGIYRVSPPSLG